MLAVLPAGGKAERFGGIHKDMLPIGEGEYLLTAAMERARRMGASRCVVVTSAEKAALHERLIGRDDLLMVSTGRGLWEAVKATFLFKEDALLLLPDTVFTPIGRPVLPFSFGVFETNEPERFSVIQGNTILTKQPAPHPSLAWGCVCWGRGVIRYWQGRVYAHYDDAFRDAMRAFGYATFPIADYHDLGDWAAYRRYVTNGAE